MLKAKEADIVDQNLDKSLMKFICRMLYGVGLGDCWYEPMKLSNKTKLVYKLWTLVYGCYFGSVLFLELLVYARDEMTVHEKNDCILFAVAYTSIVSKFVIFYFKRLEIRMFLKKLINDTRMSLTKLTEAESLKKSKRTIAILWVCSFSTLVMNTADALNRYLESGVPMRITVLAFWPRAENPGVFISICAAFIQIFLWYTVLIMTVVDSLCTAALANLGFKFRTLQLYFKNLREDLANNPEGKSPRQLEDDYKRGLVGGIKLHNDTLWCVKSLQSSLGTIYSVQIVESIGLLSMTLIKLVRQERSITFLLASFAFIMVMVCLTGVSNLLAGDITHEAMLVSDAIFESGWELCQSRSIRPIVVVAIRASQTPVVMTAFGIFSLSYDNFISVLRSSYSFFAVMY